jgi:accessory colonization factor AcfC
VADQASRDADMFYSGAENMMTDFVQTFATQIDVTIVEPVYVRSATIMVHKGIPLKIEHVGDLLRPGVRVMVVQGS